MSAYSEQPVTEGFVAQLPESGGWNKGWFVFPNFGPFYNSERAARREARGGKVFHVKVTYEEVEA